MGKTVTNQRYVEEGEEKEGEGETAAMDQRVW
jgi:hypothetical protein